MLDILTDHLGSVSAVLDDQGALLSQQRYLPFGAARLNPGVGQTDFGYTGQRALGGIGLMDYNARWYGQGIGRFTQPDTIVPGAGNPQALNRYSYVLNNPILLIDPSGYCPANAIVLDGQCIHTDRSFQNQYRPWNDPSEPVEGCIGIACDFDNGGGNGGGNNGGDGGTDGTSLCDANPWHVGCQDITIPPGNRDFICYYCNGSDSTRSVDYITINLGFSIPLGGLIYGGQIGWVLDRYGNVYRYHGATAGPDASLGFSVSISGGHIGHQNDFLTGPGHGPSPNETVTESVLSGEFTNGSACFILCGGITISQTVPYYTIEAGIGMPQLSAGTGISVIRHDANLANPLWKP